MYLSYIFYNTIYTDVALEDTFMQDLWDISLRFGLSVRELFIYILSLYSPWSDKYENIHQSRYTEQVKAIIALKSQQIKSEAISYSKVMYHDAPSSSYQ